MKVYATINQGGLYREPIFIRRVVSRDGLVLEDGSHPMDPASTWRERLDAAYRQWSSPEYRPLDTATSFVMTSLLENVVKNGTAVAASRIGFPVARKTELQTIPMMLGLWATHQIWSPAYGSGTIRRSDPLVLANTVERQPSQSGCATIGSTTLISAIRRFG